MSRILVIPSLSYSSLEKDVFYNEVCDYCEKVSEKNGNYFFNIVIPSWVKDGLRGIDNVRYVYFDSTRDRGINRQVGFSALELGREFARRGGRNICDLVITDCSLFALYLNKILSDSDKPDVPTLIWDKNILKQIDEKDGILLSSNIISNYVLCNSIDYIDRVVDFVRLNLGTSASRHVADSCVVVDKGYDLEKIDKLFVEKYDNFTICIGGMFQQGFSRNFDFKVCRDLSVSGVANINLVTQSSENLSDYYISKHDDSFLTERFCNLRFDKYIELCSRCHCFVSSIDHKRQMDFEDDILLMIIGQIGILPNVDFVVSRLGDDYPFLYEPGNMEHIFYFVKWIKENFVDAQELMVKYREMLRKRHDINKTSSILMRKFDDLVEKRRVSNDGCNIKKLVEPIEELANQLGDEFSLVVFLDILEEKFPHLKPWGRKGTMLKYGENINLPTLYDIRMVLDNLGWKDRCDSSYIMLKHG